MLMAHFESLLWIHRYHFGWNLANADSSFFLTACDYFSSEQPTYMLTTKIVNSLFICSIRDALALFHFCMRNNSFHVGRLRLIQGKLLSYIVSQKHPQALIGQLSGSHLLFSQGEHFRCLSILKLDVPLCHQLQHCVFLNWERTQGKEFKLSHN